jgi:membrane-bound ClpP family serine protease
MQIEYLDELQQVAEYRRARKTLRAAGIGGLVFGTLALFTGVSMLAQNFINIILIMIGLLLLVEGCWNVFRPTAEGILVDGAALLLVGLWNIFVTVFNVLAAVAAGGAATPPVQWGLMGVLQIAYGIYRFVSYRRFADAFRKKPDEDELKRMDELVKKVMKTNPKDSASTISFKAKSFFGQQQWKGQLAENAAIFVAAQTHDVLVAGKDDVQIEVHGKVAFGKTRKAKVRIRTQTLEALISPDSLTRYEAWESPQVSG